MLQTRSINPKPGVGVIAFANAKSYNVGAADEQSSTVCDASSFMGTNCTPPIS